MKQYKNIIIPTFVLTLIAGLVAGLLAFTYNATGIANLGTGLSEDELKEYAPIVLPEASGLTAFSYDSEEKDLLGVYAADDHSGVALHIQTAGYAGKSKPIEAFIGFNQDGEIQGITIVSCQETPGLGTKIQDEAYLKNYLGISGSADEVDTITSATISSAALKNGVNFAMQMFEQIKGEVFA